MYVTRPLSLYRKNREALSLAPPEGPNSGYLVVYDGFEYESSSCCWGLCNNYIDISVLPFPQNKVINISDSEFSLGFIFIPVLNQPLSSNRYYAIESHGPNKGKAVICSKKEDMGTSCFGTPLIKDVDSLELDALNSYQQIEIIYKKNHCGFTAKSITDGFPPEMLRFKNWTAKMETPKYYQLKHQAHGLNSSLRTFLPSLNFSLARDSSVPVVVGKWYCPFIFVEEVMNLKDRVETSMFYEMTLEQRWVRIFECDNIGKQKKLVLVNVAIETDDVRVMGRKAKWDEKYVYNNVVWFWSVENIEGKDHRIGLNMAIVERMKWEQKRVGWIRGDEGKRIIERAEEFHGKAQEWTKFGCYVLVETFVLKRMDGSLLLTYDFKHTHQIRCKWE